MLKRTLLLSTLLLATSGILAQDQAAPQDQAVLPEQVVEKTVPPKECSSCHGLDGNSFAGVFPNLAGQNSEYLFKQFKEFKNKARLNDMMSAREPDTKTEGWTDPGMIYFLPDDLMKVTAEFFATQKLKPAAAKNSDKDSDAFKMGEKLWRAGIASKGLPACSACHGPAGKGMPAQYPALAGQYPEYLEVQLKAFRDEIRANDPSKMMREIALKMTDKEIQAVSDYAAGLR